MQFVKIVENAFRVALIFLARAFLGGHLVFDQRRCHILIITLVGTLVAPSTHPGFVAIACCILLSLRHVVQVGLQVGVIRLAGKNIALQVYGSVPSRRAHIHIFQVQHRVVHRAVHDVGDSLNPMNLLDRLLYPSLVRILL